MPDPRYVGLAKIHLESYNYQQALPHLKRAAKIAPHDPSYRQALQQCLEALK